MVLGIEPRPGEIISGTDSFLLLLESVESDSLGAIVDSSHMFISRETPSISIGKLGKKISGVHVSDTDGLTDVHWPPGQGQIDWSDILIALELVNYGGTLSIDVTGIDVKEELIEGKLFLTNLIRKLGMIA